MRNRCAARRRGMTVPEVVVAACLMSVVLVGVVTMSTSSGNEWSAGSSRMAADNRASLSLQALTKDMLSGSSATVNTSGTVLTLKSALMTATGDYDRTVTAAVSRRYYLYQGTLYKQIGTATPIALGTGMSALTFSVNGPKITIHISATNHTGNAIKETTLDCETTLRNPPIL